MPEVPDPRLTLMANAILLTLIVYGIVTFFLRGDHPLLHGIFWVGLAVYFLAVTFVPDIRSQWNWPRTTVGFLGLVILFLALSSSFIVSGFGNPVSDVTAGMIVIVALVVFGIAAIVDNRIAARDRARGEP